MTTLFKAADAVMDALIQAIETVLPAAGIFDDVSPLDEIEAEPAHKPSLPNRFVILQDQDLEDLSQPQCLNRFQVDTFCEVWVGGRKASREIRDLGDRIATAVLGGLDVAGFQVETIDLPVARIRNDAEIARRAAAITFRVVVSPL